jgi:hypothetical protein
MCLVVGSIGWILDQLYYMAEQYGLNSVWYWFLLGYLFHLIYSVPMVMLTWNKFVTRMIDIDKIDYSQSTVMVNIVLVFVTVT